MPDTTHGDSLFSEEIQEHGTAVRRILSGYSTDPDHLDDLLQKTWKRAWERRKQFRGGNHRAWLCTIGRHVAIDDFRARQARKRAMDRFATDSEETSQLARQEGEAGPDEWANRVKQAMSGQLTPRERDVVGLRLCEGLTNKETSEQLDISASTVRVHLANGLEKLRAALREGSQ